jgi:diguanylate cyclase (GGDEF)-like protein/PAS domain S-box-containing protein
MSAVHAESLFNDRSTIDNVQLEQLFGLQRHALEMIAAGQAAGDILDQLCRMSEALLPNSVASIMLLDDTGTSLKVRAAPSIPASAIEALNGLTPGPDTGSCGNAVHRNEPVYVERIFDDPRWAGLLDVAKRFNLQACWSAPIRAALKVVVGSFALTSFECRTPNPFHRRLLETGSYLAGLVLEREEHARRLHAAGVAFDHMREGVMVTDARHCIIQVNRAFEHITGYSAQEVIGKNPRILNSDRQHAAFYREFYRTLHETGEWRGEIWNRRKKGDVYPQWLSVKAIRDAEGKLSSHVSVFADISDTKRSERKLWHLAHHDALSDLPNRLLLSARLEQAIRHASRYSSGLALLFIDLDHFKNINDSLGHQAGDQLLRTVSARLQGLMQQGDTVARLGGDEFVVLLEDITDPADAQRVAERVIDELSRPVVLCGKSLVTTASIGISIYPGDARDPDSLLQHADVAMYRAKELGRNHLAFYAPWLTKDIRERIELEHDLRGALANREFLLHYQPQFAAGDGRLVAVEALLRWRHPQRGMLPPNTFIPIAEETGLIRDIGCWVTETACRQAQAWQAGGHQGFTLAVNLSPFQLTAGCASRLLAILQRTGLRPECLEFEITESLLVEDGGYALQQLAEIREQVGMKIAMDDFGTGHSSLSQLKRLPISKLKIDRSFIRDLPDDSHSSAIVKAIVLMAHALGLQVVAEGVETAAQRRWLCDAGCDLLQGYLLGKPVPAQEITRCLDTGKLRAGASHQ